MFKKIFTLIITLYFISSSITKANQVTIDSPKENYYWCIHNNSNKDFVDVLSDADVRTRGATSVEERKAAAELYEEIKRLEPAYPMYNTSIELKYIVKTQHGDEVVLFSDGVEVHGYNYIIPDKGWVIFKTSNVGSLSMVNIDVLEINKSPQGTLIGQTINKKRPTSISRDYLKREFEAMEYEDKCIVDAGDLLALSPSISVHEIPPVSVEDGIQHQMFMGASQYVEPTAGNTQAQFSGEFMPGTQQEINDFRGKSEYNLLCKKKSEEQLKAVEEKGRQEIESRQNAKSAGSEQKRLVAIKNNEDARAAAAAADGKTRGQLKSSVRLNQFKNQFFKPKKS